MQQPKTPDERRQSRAGVNGREVMIAKAVLTAINNTRRGSGEAREEESIAIQWTLWGKQAENATEYLGSAGGSRAG